MEELHKACMKTSVLLQFFRPLVVLWGSLVHRRGQYVRDATYTQISTRAPSRMGSRVKASSLKARMLSKRDVVKFWEIKTSAGVPWRC